MTSPEKPTGIESGYVLSAVVEAFGGIVKFLRPDSPPILDAFLAAIPLVVLLNIAASKLHSLWENRRS